MRVAAGILTIIGGFIGGTFWTLILHELGVYGVVVYIPIILAVIGGVMALRRVHWGWALAGAICSLLFPFTGIPAIILLVKSKGEFDSKLRLETERNKQRQFFNVRLACELMRKSTTQILRECAAFDARLLTDDEAVNYRIDKHYGQFGALVQFLCDFRLRDYQAFSIVTISFIENRAVECVVSLGRPVNLNRYGSENEVAKVFIVFLEKLYLNGRIQEEDELGTRVYTWKKDNRTVVSFISYPPSMHPADTGAYLGVQIRDTQLHPQGAYLELLYNRAQKLR